MSGWKSKNVSGRTFKAVITFKVPKKPLDYWIPKDVDAWNEFVAGRVKKHLKIQALTDRELKQVVRRSICSICQEFSKEEKVTDPFLPESYYWNEEKVGGWLQNQGWSYLIEVFQSNGMDGRKLMRVNVKFLLGIGLRDLSEIKEIHGAIRNLLGLPLESKTTCSELGNLKEALMEKFLWKKSFTGRKADRLTFTEFCADQGFNMSEFRDS